MAGDASSVSTLLCIVILLIASVYLVPTLVDSLACAKTVNSAANRVCQPSLQSTRLVYEQ